MTAAAVMTEDYGRPVYVVVDGWGPGSAYASVGGNSVQNPIFGVFLIHIWDFCDHMCNPNITLLYPYVKKNGPKFGFFWSQMWDL